MLLFFLPYEKDLLLFINHAHTPFLDHSMWMYSNMWIWMPLVVLLLFNLIYKKDWRQFLTAMLCIALMFLLCDQFSSHLIKPIIARPRPTHYPGVMEQVRVLYNYAGGEYGFMSGHATNSFGFVMFTSLLFRNRYYSLVTAFGALLVCYSRVYLGVHFVSDIVAGALFGMLIGFLVYRLYAWLISKWEENGLSVSGCVYSCRQINITSAVMFSYLILTTICSSFVFTVIKK